MKLRFYWSTRVGVEVFEKKGVKCWKLFVHSRTVETNVGIWYPNFGFCVWYYFLNIFGGVTKEFQILGFFTTRNQAIVVLTRFVGFFAENWNELFLSKTKNQNQAFNFFDCSFLRYFSTFLLKSTIVKLQL